MSMVRPTSSSLAVCAAAIVCLALFSACSGDGTARTDSRGRIVFDGVGEQGIFDPSLARDPASSRIWMSYSEVDNSAWSTNPSYNHLIHTRIAYSDDAGNDWTDAGILVNTSEDVTITVDEVDHQGTWVHEVSALVFDPDDDPGKRWKIFWHHYLWLDGAQLFQHGWIGMKSAPSPAGPWSAERKIFVGSMYDAASDAILGTPEVRLDQLHADLDSAALVRDGGMPRVITTVNGSAGSFNGAAGYVQDATGSGIIYSEAFLDEMPRFRIFMSHVNL
ncbi:MAG: hypothetical protein KBA61_14635 [Spirochaetes bacterium]|nr:hypothetical protein [Spirochaetota bacterium]